MIWTNPVFTKSEIEEDTPSRKDGISSRLEIELKVLGCIFIRRASAILEKNEIISSTAQVLLWRFYAIESLRKHGIITISMGCLFLACKVEEEPMSLRHVLNAFDFVQQTHEDVKYEPIMLFGMDYYEGIKAIMQAEMIILRSIGFNVKVYHPHAILACYLKQLEMFEISRQAWAYLNDLYATSALIRFQPHVLACASIQLALEDCKIKLEVKEWWKLFDATYEDLKEICLDYHALKLVTQKTSKLPLTLAELETYLRTK